MDELMARLSAQRRLTMLMLVRLGVRGVVIAAVGIPCFDGLRRRAVHSRD